MAKAKTALNVGLSVLIFAMNQRKVQIRDRTISQDAIMNAQVVIRLKDAMLSSVMNVKPSASQISKTDPNS